MSLILSMMLISGVFLFNFYRMFESSKQRPIQIENVPLFVNIISSRENSELRKAIRETWGKTVRFGFVIGNKACRIPPKYRADGYPCEWQNGIERPTFEEIEAYRQSQIKINSALVKEAQENKDIIALETLDTYGNLAAKTLGAVDWCYLYYRGSWCMKIDDDSYVRSRPIIEYIGQLDTTINRVIGYNYHPTFVKKRGRWAELKYSKNLYPRYPNGGVGYILSPALVQTLGENVEKLELYNSEDASLGIWIETLGLKVLFDSRRGSFVPRPEFSERNCDNKKILKKQVSVYH